ncbi:MAG: hypothetical protein ACFE8C_11050 [Promethearchaeota archaeon]
MSPDPPFNGISGTTFMAQASLYGPTSFCNIYNAISKYYDYRTESGEEYKYADLPTLNNEGYILLRQCGQNIPDKSILGDFWTQSIVRVKIGVIPENHKVLVIFEFAYEPKTPLNQVQILLEQDVIETFDVPMSDNWVRRNRAVLITGDGETSIDLFLRPLSSRYFRFYLVEWRYIE